MRILIKLIKFYYIIILSSLIKNLSKVIFQVLKLLLLDQFIMEKSKDISCNMVRNRWIDVCLDV
jgi:hypothetical protein